MSRQWWEWHLTATGWREGQYVDPYGSIVGNPMPGGTVLTVRQFVELSNGQVREDSERTAHGSEAAIQHLQQKYGTEPPAF